MRPDFKPLPQLWPETYTDAYALDTNIPEELLLELAQEIVEETAWSDFDYRVADHHFFTTDQTVVSILTEKLYGREFAHIHVHYPNRFDDAN